jgi:hypothetical protein
MIIPPLVVIVGAVYYADGSRLDHGLGDFAREYPRRGGSRKATIFPASGRRARAGGPYFPKSLSTPSDMPGR